MKQTFKEAGYQYLYSIRYTGDANLRRGHVLLHNGKKELWYANKNHASFGLIYKNTHLEFACSIND